MDLTPEQLAAVRCDENLLLEACPGSGKTRAIVAKTLRCLDTVRGTPRKIAVITYTNAAVYEIENRLRIYSATEDLECCEVSTIHSFCLNYILKRFAWRCAEYPAGFTLLPSDSDEFQAIVAAVCTAHGLARDAREEFQNLNRDLNGEPILGAGALVTAAAAHAFWQKLHEAKAVDFATIIYLTNRLLTEYPSLARALSCRFRWVLVDEFQDTTVLQIEILKKIHAAARSSFFLVGDPHQSIFRFAGARPELSEGFAAQIAARRDFQLSQNWRSNPQIVAQAGKLRPRPVAMTSAGPIAQDTVQPVYVHAATPFEAIEQHFLPALAANGIEIGNAAILAPSWFALINVGRSLRASGVPIIGPGARPYQRSQLFARLAEYACEYIERRNPRLLRNLQRELHRMVSDASETDRMDIFSHAGRTTIYRLLRIAAALRDDNPSAEHWLGAAATQFGAQLVADGFLPAAAAALLSQSATAMCAQMRRNYVNPAVLTVSDLGLFAATDRSLRLLTMHAAKGLEWDAVALIGLNEGQLPNRRATSAADLDESCRLFYVALTRAKRFVLYVSDQSNWRNTPSRFLDDRGLDLVA